MNVKIAGLAVLTFILGCSGGSTSSKLGDNKPFCDCQPTDPKKIRNAKPDRGPIVVLGDGLAFGHGADPKSLNTPSACIAGRTSNTVTTLAHDGETSDVVAKSVDKAVAMKAKIVFISAGIDDMLLNRVQPGSYPNQQTLSELGAQFDKLLESGALVVYLGLNPQTYLSERLPMAWDMANQKGVLVIDGMGGLWKDPSLMADDLHPNEKGYSVMCLRIISALKDHLPE